jgi:membrane-bound lytic murein transglycosylase A
MWTLRPLSFDALAGWAVDDHAPRSRPLPVMHIARKPGPIGEARRAFRLKAWNRYSPQRPRPLRNPTRAAFSSAISIVMRSQETAGSRGFVTAFYEPEIEASRERNKRFRTPFYRRPDDLVTVTADNRPFAWDENYRFARRADDGTLLVYPDPPLMQAGWTGAISKSPGSRTRWMPSLPMYKARRG